MAKISNIFNCCLLLLLLITWIVVDEESIRIKNISVLKFAHFDDKNISLVPASMFGQLFILLRAGDFGQGSSSLFAELNKMH